MNGYNSFQLLIDNAIVFDFDTMALSVYYQLYIRYIIVELRTKSCVVAIDVPSYQSVATYAERTTELYPSNDTRRYRQWHHQKRL